jgi:hypothetical protein
MKYQTFEERFNYLSLKGYVGSETFGFDRYLNQKFYRSTEWKQVRDFIIVRDSGCDLGIQDRQIQTRIVIHHMNPLEKTDITDSTEFLLNPEYLICTSYDTHQAIHYGNTTSIITMPKERTRNDTCPWKH